jgi:hypothetical protein
MLDSRRGAKKVEDECKTSLLQQKVGKCSKWEHVEMTEVKSLKGVVWSRLLCPQRKVLYL